MKGLMAMIGSFQHILCSAVLLGVMWAGVLNDASAQTADRRYRIGVILPLSGQVASMGSYVRRGIDLAVADLPEASKAKIELFYEDDQFDPNKTLSAYRKLSGSPGIDAVFTILSPPANALGPLTEQNKQILMAIGASDATIAVGKQYSFIHWVIPAVLGENLVRELRRRDYKKIAFLTAEVTGAIADVDGAVDAAQAAGLKDRIIFQDTFPKEQTDYRTIIAKLRQKQADAVVAVFFAGALSSFTKQCAAANLPADILGMETFEDENEVKAAQGTLLGKRYVNASDPADWFVEKYKKQYGEHPGWGSANGYDTLRLIADAVSAAGTDNARIRDFLRAVKDYEGAAGKYSASGDNRFTLPATLKVITEQGFEKVVNDAAKP